MLTTNEIADAVVELLGRGSFSATRLSAIRFDASDLAELTITVAPRGLSDVPVSRVAVGRIVRIDVGIQKQIAASGDVDGQVEELLGVVDSIRAWLLRRENLSLDAEAMATLIRVDQDPMYIPQHLTEKHVFTSVLSLSYNVAEAL